MATGTIVPKMKCFYYSGTTPSTYAEFRQTIPGAYNNGYAICAGICIQNGNNSSWYQITESGFDTAPFMNGADLRFKLKSDNVGTYGNQPFRALIFAI